MCICVRFCIHGYMVAYRVTWFWQERKISSQEIQLMPVLQGSIGEKSDPQIGMDAKFAASQLTECKSVLLEMNYRQSGGHYGRLLLKMAVFPSAGSGFFRNCRIRSSVSSLMKRSNSARSPGQRCWWSFFNGCFLQVVLLPYSELQSQYEKGETGETAFQKIGLSG